MYPLEPNELSARNALASDHSKSMFNPIKDTCLHKAVTFTNSTAAKAVTRTTSLPDAFMYDPSRCPALVRIIRDHQFDMEAVLNLVKEKLGKQLDRIESYVNEQGKDLRSMSLYELFHAVDHLIADLHPWQKIDETLKPIVHAAGQIQTFILAHNFCTHDLDKGTVIERYYGGLVTQPIVEVLGNVFEMLREENPINLVYVTHVTHDF